VSNYKIVKKGQFAYNPSRVNVGSLDLLRNFDDGILSPMYVVFETNEKKLLPDFLYYQLKTYWFKGHIPMFVQGSVRDSLSFDGLSGMKFFIPSLEEQQAITNIMDSATNELKQYEQKLETLQLQKKGLMQQLLTGKVRVKI
jgi:type I restriction enzyme S subunit